MNEPREITVRPRRTLRRAARFRLVDGDKGPATTALARRLGLIRNDTDTGWILPTMAGDDGLADGDWIVTLPNNLRRVVGRDAFGRLYETVVA